MDPNATLRLLAEAETAAERADHYRNLNRWLRSGGFPPDWMKYPEGQDRYVMLENARRRRNAISRERHSFMGSLGLKRNRDGSYE